jgi:hypothetical protein
MDKFPFYSQLDMMDCGPACLRMIAFLQTPIVPRRRANSGSANG